jgi:hypothetical protein
MLSRSQEHGYRAEKLRDHPGLSHGDGRLDVGGHKMFFTSEIYQGDWRLVVRCFGLFSAR